MKATFLLALALCATTHAEEADSPAYKDGYAKGQAEAEVAIAEKAATIYVYGMPTLNALDKETGLPLTSIAGCIVGDAVRGRDHGYNERIREWIKVEGLPDYSRKPWEKELFNQREYFTTRSKKEQPFALARRQSISPDGKYSLKLCEVRVAARARGGICLQAGDEECQVQFPFGDDVRQAVSLFWGPERSDVAFITWAQQGKGTVTGQRFAVLDLRTAKWLRVEVAEASTPKKREAN